MENGLGNKEVMARNIKYFLSLKGINRKDLCRDLGFNYSTLNEWLRGAKYPRIDKIERMAKYFHISKADLVEDHNNNMIKEYMAIDIQERDLLAGFRTLDTAGKDLVMRILEAQILATQNRIGGGADGQDS